MCYNGIHLWRCNQDWRSLSAPCPQASFCEWLDQLRVHTVCGRDSHHLMTDGYTIYDWSLPITQEDVIVHHSHKIFPLSSRQREKVLPHAGTGLCHEIEPDSSRYHFPHLIFEGDSGRLFADSLTVCNGWGEIDKSNFLLCSKIVPEWRIYTRAPISNILLWTIARIS